MRRSETIEDETSQFVSRVTVDKGFRYANSLNVLIGRLVNLAPVLEQLGLSSFEDFVSLFKRAGASLAKLDEGKTVADDNGNKVISAELKLKSLYVTSLVLSMKIWITPLAQLSIHLRERMKNTCRR